MTAGFKAGFRRGRRVSGFRGCKPPDAAGFGSFASIIVSAISSVFAGIIGLPLLIAGLVWFLVRGSHNKRARQAQVAAGRPGAVQS